MSSYAKSREQPRSTYMRNVIQRRCRFDIGLFKNEVGIRLSNSIFVLGPKVTEQCGLLHRVKFVSVDSSFFLSILRCRLTPVTGLVVGDSLLGFDMWFTFVITSVLLECNFVGIFVCV
jgi:hypothetical protein